EPRHKHSLARSRQKGSKVIRFSCPIQLPDGAQVMRRADVVQRMYGSLVDSGLNEGDGWKLSSILYPSSDSNLKNGKAQYYTNDFMFNRVRSKTIVESNLECGDLSPLSFNQH